MLDPLAVLLENTYIEKELTPAPLVSSAYEILISAGMAVVTTERLFKNIEAVTIEAVLTFPLPVQATLYEMSADVGGRKLWGRVQAAAKARADYEDAIVRGKSAVLHEERLRGLHLVSVANIAPGEDIRVTTKWVMPLSVAGDRAMLRIPQTVGQIYGRSGLEDVDDLKTGGPSQTVTLSVRADVGVSVIGADLIDGRAVLLNSRPIDIVANLWEPQPITAATADGRAVTLTLTPLPDGEQPLDLAILVDHSSSMAGGAHAAAKAGVAALSRSLEGQDFVDLWEFDDIATHVGSVREGAGADLLGLSHRLAPPSGGTEIGGAIEAVLRHSDARDVLVLTDGLSHALDVEALSRKGRRISALLIGEDSLEARIGHLCALTGGHVFIATANDLGAAMAAAIGGLRRGFAPLPCIDRMPERLWCERNNVRIEAVWSPSPFNPVSTDSSRAAAAIATSLILSCATTELAQEAAAAQGVVSHLTSLTLVDEEGVSQTSLPTLRKASLASPFAFEAAELYDIDACYNMEPILSDRCIRSARKYRDLGPRPIPNHKLPWRFKASKLAKGDLSGLPPALIREIMKTASTSAVIAFARRNGLSAVVVAVGLFALMESENRWAARALKVILASLGSDGEDDLAELQEQVRLELEAAEAM